jgi:flavodoxin
MHTHEEQETLNLKEQKCLVVYYSREGNNDVGRTIMNLPIGNTKVVATMIREVTKGNAQSKSVPPIP